MIKFFRIIRNKLIKDGSLKKYLLYAIGEILLVVIGILVALQVNNWNEHRNLHQQLISNLEKMYDDLLSDSLMIQQCMADYEKNYQRGVLLWNQLYENTELPEASQFIQETQSIARTIYLDLNDIQFSAISKSNSLKMIADEELRESIILYYTDEHSVHLFNLLQERNIQFHKMVVDAIPLNAHIYILKGDSNSYDSWVEQSPNIHNTILEMLKRKDELPLALKDTIRSYLLSISQLERIAKLNQGIRSGLQKFLDNYSK